MSDKILTRNPDPKKKGVNIDKDRYDFIRAEILKTLKHEGPLASMKLIAAMDKRLGGDVKFGSSIGWYTMAVRLDLEARGEILYDRSTKKPVLTLP